MKRNHLRLQYALNCESSAKRLSREALQGLRSWPVKGFEDVRVYYLVHQGGVRAARCFALEFQH